MRVILTTVTILNDIVSKVNIKDFNESLYSIGLPYIHSYLESKTHEVKHLDLISVKFDENKKILTDEINLFNPDVIGFSIVSGNHINTYKMIEYIHENYPKIKIIVGGIHATIMYEQIVKKYPYVVVVIGEGEITFGELLEPRELKSVKGIAFYLDDNVVKTENRELIENLDTLPFPIHMLPPEHTRANIMTSRGCTASCSFCVLNPNAKRIQRMRSAKNVVDEIESIAKNYPNVKKMYILDDAFLTNNNRAIEICNEIIKRGLNYLEFQCQSRFKPFHKEILPYLEKANFILLQFGLETGNENMLKACHKVIKQQDMIDTITLLKDSHIVISTFLIVGLPRETRDTILETAKFIHKIQRIKYIMYYDYSPGILLAYPGTEVYEIMKSSGKISDEYWLTNNIVPFYTVEHSNEELLELKSLLVNRIAFMPLSLTKLYYQKSLLIPIFKYTIKYYYTKPLTLFKIIFRSI